MSGMQGAAGDVLRADGDVPGVGARRLRGLGAQRADQAFYQHLRGGQLSRRARRAAPGDRAVGGVRLGGDGARDGAAARGLRSSRAGAADRGDRRAPAGLTGLFIAGALAAAMSTIDSYYSSPRHGVRHLPAALPPRHGRRVDIRLTRWMIVFSAAACRLRSSSRRSSRRGSPWHGAGRERWCRSSSRSMRRGSRDRLRARLEPRGLGVAIVLRARHGVRRRRPEWGTRIWTVDVAGRTLALWQDYALLFALPASIIGYAVGHRVGRPRAADDARVSDRGLCRRKHVSTTRRS